ncbi:hypothetical protein BSL82_17345 [Tardibacter chloracetimidivorans]|uniref:TonB-dependent receptor n=1 Tax=Tardibacter chloracetimidivorans TaxID=1921510 RepID=A0A1L3ZYX7_9SPHN|nr:TonB-dependent receptor [Tardibacter chloracetimidivorans]API60828.1 hypothetical protein BSL82_17345 [Tardibacter chloracetimidivorans]
MKMMFACTTAALALSVPSLAEAQTTPASSTETGPTSSPANSASTTDVGLQEIIVTAQKRSENLQTVPIAITAVSGESLASRGVSNTMQLGAASPGLNINETAGAFQPSIRGIGTSSSLAENPVALYVDGVYIPQQRDGLREFEDIEQISVLYGPQGTLFGRNATAGVIQITTKAPSFDFSGRVHAGIDSYLTAKLGGYVTGGLSNNVAASLSGSFTKQGKGWGKNLVTGLDTYRIEHDWQVRGKLLFRLGENTNVTLAGDYIDWRRRMAELSPTPGTGLGVPNPYTANPLKSVYDSYSAVENFVALKGGGASLTIDHDGGGVKLVSITAYRRVKSTYQSDGLPIGQFVLVPNSPNSPSRSISQEFQVLSDNSGPLSWVFGLYYFNYRNGVEPLNRNFGGFFAPLPTSVVQRQTFATEKTESVAPFGEFKWEFMPDTHLIGGVRYTYERRSLENARNVFVTAAGTSTTTFHQGSVSYSEPTFRIGLDHQIADEIMGYVTFNKGFKSGGFNIGSPQTAPYLPEKLNAYEVGLKSQLFDRNVRLNLSAFYYNYSNLQVTQFVNLIQTVTNGPKARIYGLNADLEARISSSLRLSGGFELKHATFTSYPNAVFGQVGPGGVGATLVPGDATGNRLPQAQNFSGTLAVDYHHEMSAGSIDFNATASYNGDFYFTADNRIRQAPYTILNSSVTWTLPGDRVTLKIWGTNLANERYATTALETTLGFVSGYNSAPRTVGGTVSYKF